MQIGIDYWINFIEKYLKVTKFIFWGNYTKLKRELVDIKSEFYITFFFFNIVLICILKILKVATEDEHNNIINLPFAGGTDSSILITSAGLMLGLFIYSIIIYYNQENVNRKYKNIIYALCLMSSVFLPYKIIKEYFIPLVAEVFSSFIKTPLVSAEGFYWTSSISNGNYNVIFLITNIAIMILLFIYWLKKLMFINNILEIKIKHTLRCLVVITLLNIISFVAPLYSFIHNMNHFIETAFEIEENIDFLRMNFEEIEKIKLQERKVENICINTMKENKRLLNELSENRYASFSMRYKLFLLNNISDLYIEADENEENAKDNNIVKENLRLRKSVLRLLFNNFNILNFDMKAFDFIEKKRILDLILNDNSIYGNEQLKFEISCYDTEYKKIKQECISKKKKIYNKFIDVDFNEVEKEFNNIFFIIKVYP